MHCPSPPLAPEPATHRAVADHASSNFVRDWLAHVSAGRIGGNPPTPPAIAAQQQTNDALFRTIPVLSEVEGQRDRRPLGR